jgi:uncharacterized protein DUF4397
MARSKFSGKLIVCLFAGAGIVAMFSCSKSNSSPAGAGILFANGCVGATSTSLTVNGTNLPNAASIPYLGNSGYQGVAAGAATINGILNGVGSLGSLSTTLNVNQHYSVFNCGSVLADSLVIIADQFPVSGGNYAYVRLVNVSSDPTANAITAVVGNNTVGSNIAYGAASAFVQITPGAYNVTALNTNKPVNVATLSNVQFSAGQILTLMYSGNSNQIVGFKVTIISNN